uniref:RAB44, member RAS oncogene family n=1 Tax=Esox lucius TaxID=8010 RepID=A0AAY5KM23_ESOLU
MGSTRRIREGHNTEEEKMEAGEDLMMDKIIGQMIGDPEAVERSFIEFEKLMESKDEAGNDKNEGEEMNDVTALTDHSSSFSASIQEGGNIDADEISSESPSMMKDLNENLHRPYTDVPTLQSYQTDDTLNSNPTISGLKHEHTLKEEALDESVENMKFPPDPPSEQSYFNEEGTAEIDSHTPVTKEMMGSTHTRTPNGSEGEERREGGKEEKMEAGEDLMMDKIIGQMIGDPEAVERSFIEFEKLMESKDEAGNDKNEGEEMNDVTALTDHSSSFSASIQEGGNIDADEISSESPSMMKDNPELLNPDKHVEVKEDHSKAVPEKVAMDKEVSIVADINSALEESGVVEPAENPREADEVEIEIAAECKKTQSPYDSAALTARNQQSEDEVCLDHDTSTTQLTNIVDMEHLLTSSNVLKITTESHLSPSSPSHSDVGESKAIGRRKKMGSTRRKREALNTEEEKWEAGENVMKDEIIGQMIGDPEAMEGTFPEIEMLMESKDEAGNDNNEGEEINNVTALTDHSPSFSNSNQGGNIDADEISSESPLIMNELNQSFHNPDPNFPTFQSYQTDDTLISSPDFSSGQCEDTLMEENFAESKENNDFPPDPPPEQTYLGEEATASKGSHTPVKKRKMGSTRSRTPHGRQGEQSAKENQEDENLEDQEFIGVVGEVMIAETTEPVKLEEHVEQIAEDQARGDSHNILKEEEIVIVAEQKCGLEKPELVETAEILRRAELAEVQIVAECESTQITNVTRCESKSIGKRRKMGSTRRIREGHNTEVEKMEAGEDLMMDKIIGQMIGESDAVERSFIEFEKLMESKDEAGNDKNEGEEINDVTALTDHCSSLSSSNQEGRNIDAHDIGNESPPIINELNQTLDNTNPHVTTLQSYHTDETLISCPDISGGQREYTLMEGKLDESKENISFPPDPPSEQSFLGEQGTVGKRPHSPVKRRTMGSSRIRTAHGRQGGQGTEKIREENDIEDQEFTGVMGGFMIAEKPVPVMLEEPVEKMTEDQASFDSEAIVKEEAVAKAADQECGIENPELVEPAENIEGVEVQKVVCESTQILYDPAVLMAESQQSGYMVCLDPDSSTIQLSHAVDIEHHLSTSCINPRDPSKSSLSLSSHSPKDVGESKTIRRRKMGSTRRIREGLNTVEEKREAGDNEIMGQMIGDPEVMEGGIEMLMESKDEAGNDKNEGEINESYLNDDTLNSNPDISSLCHGDRFMEDKLDKSMENERFPPDHSSVQSVLVEEVTLCKETHTPVKKIEMGSTHSRTSQDRQVEERAEKSPGKENIEDQEVIGEVMIAEKNAPVKLEELVDNVIKDAAKRDLETKEEDLVEGTFPDSQPCMIVGEPKGVEKRRKMGSTRRTREGFHTEEEQRKPEEKIMEEEFRGETIKDSEVSVVLDQLQEEHRPEDQQERPNTGTEDVASSTGMSAEGSEQVTPALQPGPANIIDQKKGGHANKSPVARMPKQPPGTLGSSGSRSNPYNVVIVGNSSVGKTSFIKYFQSGKFSIDHSATIGIDTCIQSLTVDGSHVTLQLWDTAGQERYHSITRQVFHKAQGLLLMYDITSSQSFFDVRYWANCIQEGAPDDVVLILLGNKADCAEPERQVQTHEGKNLAKEYNMLFMECSAATGDNVILSMENLARMLRQQGEKTRQEEKSLILQKEPPKKKSGCC